MKTISFFVALWVAFVAIMATASGEVGKADTHLGAVEKRSMAKVNKGLVFNAAVRNQDTEKTITVTADASTNYITVTVTGTPSVVVVTEAASACESVGPSIIVDTTPLVFTPTASTTTPGSIGTVGTSELSSITPTSFASTEVVPPTSPAISTEVPSTSELTSTVPSSTIPPTASLTSATLPPSTPTGVASNGDYLGVDIAILMELMGLSIIFMVFMMCT